MILNARHNTCDRPRSLTFTSALTTGTGATGQLPSLVSPHGEAGEAQKRVLDFSRGFVGKLGSDISVVESTSESTPQTDRQCAARPAASTESQSEVDDQNEKLT